MTWQFWSVLPVWLLSAVGAVLIALVFPSSAHLTWLAVLLAAALLATFGIQLVIRRSEGFVVRAMASVGGAVVILAAASGLLALLT